MNKVINSKNKTLSNKDKEELLKWDQRVIFDVRFKEDTKAPLQILDEVLFNSLEKFSIVAANSEALVYKIGRYFVSQGTSNDKITFINGNLIESYIGDESKDWKKKDRADEFFNTFGEEYKDKWVLIPLMHFEISIGLAMYFMSKFKKQNARGIIMYAEGPDNIVEVLARYSEDPNFYEFPKVQYRKKQRFLDEDEW